MSDHQRPDPQQGIFETLLVIDGCPVELEAHLARLGGSLAELFPDRMAPQLDEEIEACAAGIELGSIRVTVAPARATMLRTNIEVREPAPSTGTFVSLSGRKAPVQETAAHSFALPGGLGAHKWADRSLLEEAQSKMPADALPLIIDSDGTALEASRANVFAVRDGALLTPPIDGRILPGVTRMRVIELAGALEIEAREVELSSEDLPGADEVFLTGSVRGVERVRSLDGTDLPTDGEVTSALGAELRRTWAGAQVG